MTWLVVVRVACFTGAAVMFVAGTAIEYMDWRKNRKLRQGRPHNF